ncbi:MAG: hypothetical protein WCO25_03235 [Candidatus Uhrbacteria bacterium]
MKDRSPLSKVQLALLRSIDAASRMIGTPGIVPTNLAGRIACHYFRPDRVEGALNELRRSENLVLLLRDRYRVIVSPTSWQDCFLPGCAAEPLEEDRLVAMIIETGYAVVASAETTAAVRDRRVVAIRRTVHWMQRHVHLANHLLAERWYGNTLPAELSFGILSANQSDPSPFHELRTELSLEHQLKSIRVKGGHNVFHWRVTPLGVNSIEQHRAAPSLTPDVIATIATPLGYCPLPRSNQPGC